MVSPIRLPPPSFYFLTFDLFYGLCSVQYNVFFANAAHKSAEEKVKRFNTFIYSSLVITYVVLIDSSKSAIYFFKCDEFEVPNEKSKRRLAADLSIDCDSTEYEHYFFFALLMILIYPIGIPALYYVMLRSHRDILRDPEAIAAEEAAGFPNVGHVNFLIEGYEPLFYYFEVLECLRRLLLAAIIGVVSFAATAAPVAGFAISICFTWVFTYFKPFTDDSDNTLSIMLAYGKILPCPTPETDPS
jgi:hypothetical protein